MRRELGLYFRIDEKSICVAPGAVEVPSLLSETTRQIVRDQLAWRGPEVVTLRSLSPRYGVDLMVQAAAMVRPHMPDVRWCIMGRGELMKPLLWLARQLKVDDIIEFTGYLPEEDVLKRMQAADAFMLPTRSLEGFGLVTIEANACGLPVVATPVGANIEVVSSSDDNLVAECITPETLAEALLDVLKRDVSHVERAKRLRDHVSTHFSWEKHDRLFLQALESLG